MRRSVTTGDVQLHRAIRTWWRTFASAYGLAELPRSYLALDVETSGLDAEDLPLEVGLVRVRDGRVVGRKSLVLDWFRSRYVDRAWLVNRLETTRAEMARQGAVYHQTADRLQAEGENPVMALRYLRRLFARYQRAGGAFVSHNGWRFDCPMLECAFATDLRKPWRFKEDSDWDTGAVFKGIQLGRTPRSWESMRAYFLDVIDTRAKGVRWSLSYCAGRLKLVKKPKLHRRRLHSADYDAVLIHRLIEKLRRIIGHG